MKEIYTTLILILLCVATMAQNQDDTFANKYRINFAIPDISAYKALNIEQSKILRPSDVKALSLIANDLLSGNNILIPEAIGVEVAPWQLSSRKTLADYRNSSIVRFLHRTSLSFAAQRDVADNNASKIAFGFKTSFVSKEGDIKRQDALLKTIFDAQGLELKIRNNLLLQFMKEKGYTAVDMADSEKQEEFKRYINNTQPVNEFIDKVIEAYKEENWNHRRFDLAFTFAGSSRDTIIKINEPKSNHLKYETFSLFATAAFKVQKWGQLLVGSQFEYNPERKDSLTYQLAVPIRFYAGTNRFKGFAEAQVTFTNKKDNYFFNLGTEFNVRDGFWINIYTGLTTTEFNTRPIMVSNFDLRFTIPENFSLF
jgi:hypothetical protein